MKNQRPIKRFVLGVIIYFRGKYYFMDNRLKVLFPLLIAIALAVGVFLGLRMKVGGDFGKMFSFKYSEYEKINDIINLIKRDYVDSVNVDELTERTIEELLSKLDPHSAYLPPRDLKLIEEKMQGNFEGIGVQFRIWNDSVAVVYVIPGGPSFNSGVKAGDRIIKVDGEKIASKITNEEIMQKLKGEANSTVEIEVYRASEKAKIKKLKIKRGVIPDKSVDIAYMIIDSVFYIKLNRFSATTYHEFEKSIKQAGLNNFHSLIIDVQDNGGGYLNTAEAIVDELLPEGQVIVYTKGKNRKAEYSYATKKDLLTGKRIFVLVNEMSASASEIVAGAVQDNDRGTIIGRRTFGKGLVQEQVELFDKSALRLTVARYYTATGRCIQRPYTEGADKYYHDIADRFSNGEMQNSDSTHFNDSLKFITKKGKVVYGGGGIMPDVFVAIDTNSDYSIFNMLNNSGMINDFCFGYVDNNRGKLNLLYKNLHEFNKNFELPQNIIGELLKYSAKNGFEIREKLNKRTITLLNNQLKAMVAADLFGNEAFFLVKNHEDEIVQKALVLARNRR